MQKSKNVKSEIKMQKSKHEQLEQVQAEIHITNRLTGEVVDKIPEGSSPGEYRIQQCFAKCPSQVDQSQINENNITELMKKHKPDELALILAARNSNRQPIENHDFSQEPELMHAMTIAKGIQDNFDSLPEVIKVLFKGKPAEFLKFCENPQNREQVEKWGLAKKSQQMLEALNVRATRDEAERAKKQKEQEALDNLVRTQAATK